MIICNSPGYGKTNSVAFFSGISGSVRPVKTIEEMKKVFFIQTLIRGVFNF
ncbi:MAG: hypothetical protein E7A81_03590 [Clostridiales bacterium]|nr:hypothetical protein [Clostridiales bacterium]MDU1042331.1 hypothetical protein [Clostridiales bacterium]